MSTSINATLQLCELLMEKIKTTITVTLTHPTPTDPLQLLTFPVSVSPVSACAASPSPCSPPAGSGNGEGRVAGFSEPRVGSRRRRKMEATKLQLQPAAHSRGAGLKVDGALLSEPDISPLCGSQMKYSSSAFIAHGKKIQGVCDGTIRRERGREPRCVVITQIW